MNEFGVAAHKIGKVSETITDISEQTNILALNALLRQPEPEKQGRTLLL